MGILFIKFKPMYKVSISGTELGYVQNKEALEEKVKESIIEVEEKNVDSIDIQTNPEYELEFINRTRETNEEEVIETIKQDVMITYKYYEIALNSEKIMSVNTIEEAEELVEEVKEENQGKELDLSIIEKYTEKVKEVNTEKLEVAQNTIQTKVTQKLKEIEEQKAEEERIKSMPEVNGIKLAYTPVSGTITSRYGVSSSVRSSDHTGLDIAASTGTPIKVVASGTVTFASNKGSYGNVVKVNHGNGIETWYAHTSKMYVSEGQKVEAGTVIAAVGSTGNSTGPHLHFELRMNGQHVNPQKYLYK
ncbi:MAG: M23 family metallopeptidase [Clostridia bacterium]|nr:M23 family metallopeptidase [Clostridia bacterium]